MISDRRDGAKAKLRVARHFAGADPLQALIELRVNLLRLVGEKA
ncbi:hypothetical protein [Fuscovulum ytuae]|uniref:Transposase n=1 Tax=Fuscovulum ytuae TaxID=3042299 RepID=A0ABY8Q4D6_9RHOB|nr:hypothetical protein [Fuscovulum sp. YMD61]WGV15733.1 hypothetical protein QF092_15970 [Fuscovulum sp. YMD61]